MACFWLAGAARSCAVFMAHRCCAQLVCRTCIRKGRDEHGLSGRGDVVAMMVSLIRQWSENNGGELPDALLVLRDGVADNQFHLVKDEECLALKQVCCQFLSMCC